MIFQAEWMELAADLCKAEIVTVKRFQGLPPDSARKWELRVFCEASEKAYGAVAYV